MEIKTKFNVGDKVFVIDKNRITMVCPECQGIGELKFNEITYYCKECNGKGKVQSDDLKWVIREKVKEITKIDTHSDRGGTDIYYKDNGFYSDFIGEEKNCFATKEQAQAECDKRNKSIMKKKS